MWTAGGEDAPSPLQISAEMEEEGLQQKLAPLPGRSSAWQTFRRPAGIKAPRTARQVSSGRPASRCRASPSTPKTRSESRASTEYVPAEMSSRPGTALGSTVGEDGSEATWRPSSQLSFPPESRAATAMDYYDGGSLTSRTLWKPEMPPAKGPSCRRKMLCNFGGALGEQSLLSVKAALEPIRAPYAVTVTFDLRPVLFKLSPDDRVYVAALDTELLRRKGSGMGLDVMRASQSWIARDCICSKSGRLLEIPEWSRPGEMKLALCPGQNKDASEDAIVMLRLVAIRRRQDKQDWNAFGAAVVLRCDTVGHLTQPESHGSETQRRQVLQSTSDALFDAPDETRPEYWGVRVQQLVDFRDEIRDDMYRYCGCHRILTGGDRKGFHVCMHEPCPFRPSNSIQWDDHRSVPFCHVTTLKSEEAGVLQDLAPNTNLVVSRYILPATRGKHKGHALIMNPVQPLRVDAYVSHLWSEPFDDFVNTVDVALHREDVIFVAAFALDQHTVFRGHGRDPRTELLDKRPCATALRHADKLVVVVDRQLEALQRLWCIYEIKKAYDFLTPTFVWPHASVDLLTLKASISQVDVREAKASFAEDLLVIQDELGGDHQHMAALQRQLSEFLHARVACFAGAQQQTANFRDFCPEKFRQLHSEHERRATIKELDFEQRRKISEMNGMAAEMDRELAHLHRAMQSQRVAHEIEVNSLQQKFVEAEKQHQARLQRAEREARDRLAEKGRELESLRNLLQDARMKIAQLEVTVEEQRQLAGHQRRRAQEESRRVEEEQKRSEDQSKRLEEHRQLLLEAQQACAAESARVLDSEKKLHEAETARFRAEEALNILEDEMEMTREMDRANIESELRTEMLARAVTEEDLDKAVSIHLQRQATEQSEHVIRRRSSAQLHAQQLAGAINRSTSGASAMTSASAAGVYNDALKSASHVAQAASGLLSGVKGVGSGMKNNLFKWGGAFTKKPSSAQDEEAHKDSETGSNRSGDPSSPC
eukprot:TRINITY_DN15806_c0_g1_i1.p1 TRINITY_DN15806_c0_g1~~TRINITY_DN15806_c0_g1_i1.p1  ORF type:complete len:993 (+),score=232.30 TRINITY_DN15806_c0_g1_i1:166-3144(+)